MGNSIVINAFWKKSNYNVEIKIESNSSFDKQWHDFSTIQICSFSNAISNTSSTQMNKSYGLKLKIIRLLARYIESQ